MTDKEWCTTKHKLHAKAPPILKFILSNQTISLELNQENKCK